MKIKVTKIMHIVFVGNGYKLHFFTPNLPKSPCLKFYKSFSVTTRVSKKIRRLLL